MEKLNNKETINLLDLSDNDSDISDLILTPKKKKIKRKHRPNGSLKARQDNSCGCKRFRMRIVSLWLALVLIIIWLITLSWLTVILYGELKRMDVSIKSVIAGSEGVPDALQTCHTLDRNFKTNITHITDEIRKLNRSLNTFSGQISNIRQELEQVQVSLKSAPELTSVPNTVKALQNSIGQLEIDINDLKTTYKMLKDSTFSLQHSQEEQRDSLSKIKNTLTGLSNTTQQSQKVPSNETLIETEKLWDAISMLNKNLTHINRTLTMNITWAQEDLANDHKKVVSLQDMAQNASAQILTLQQECIKRKDQEILQNLIHSLSNRVDNLSTATKKEVTQQIQQMYSVPKNTTVGLMSSLTDVKNQIVENKPNELVRKRPENLGTTSTTETSFKTSVTQDAAPPSPSTIAKQISPNGKK